MRPINQLKDLARAMAFLSRYPMPSAAFTGDNIKVGQLVPYFPLCGVLIGLLPGLVFSIMLALHADRLMAALIALALLTLITGALHEDGLADTADGIGAGGSAERRLAIMKDSRIGTYGAIALLLSFAIRAAALASVARDVSPLMAGAAFPAVACLSRAGIVWQWHALPPARPDGVAGSAGRPDESGLQICLFSGCVLAAAILWPALGLHALVSALLFTGFATFFFTRFIAKRLSGHTGDTLGAGQQICEAAACCALAMTL